MPFGKTLNVDFLADTLCGVEVCFTAACTEEKDMKNHVETRANMVLPHRQRQTWDNAIDLKHWAIVTRFTFGDSGRSPKMNLENEFDALFHSFLPRFEVL